MIQITPIQTGIPVKTATQLEVRVLTFNTDATTAAIYYSVKSEVNETLTDGNIQMTEQEFTDWGADNTFVEEIVLNRLGLERL